MLRTPGLANAIKGGLYPPKLISSAVRNSRGDGGEGLSLAFWLSYHKLNLCVVGSLGTSLDFPRWRAKYDIFNFRTQTKDVLDTNNI